MKNIIIRKANQSDIEQIAAIKIKGWKTAYEDMIDKLKDALDKASEENKEKLEDAIKDATEKLDDIKSEYKEWQKEADNITGNDDTDSDSDDEEDDEDVIREEPNEPMSAEETEKLLLGSDSFFADLSNVSEAEKAMKNFYASVDSQADRFIKELLLSGDIDGNKVTENYRKYYSILSDIADAYGESSSENDGEIYSMLSRYKTQIKEVMYGEKKAVDLLAEPDNELSVAFLSDIVPLNGFRYNVIGEVLKKRAESCSDTLRIAVLAARQGGLLRYLDERLADENCIVDYLDSSLYYYNNEVDKLKNIKVGYRHFDVSEETMSDCLFSYDAVISDNTLHRAADLETAFKNTEDLLKQDGIVLMIEQNRNSSIVLSVAGLYEEGFRELRDRELPLLCTEEWEEKLNKRFNVTPLISNELMTAAETCIFALERRNKLAVPDTAELMSYAKTALPGYMLPQGITVLSVLPCTGNGKINRKKLSELASAVSGKADKTQKLPENENEAKIVDCFEKVLKLSFVGVTDEFFSLGGDSLSAISLANAIREATGAEITLPEIFTLQTPGNIAESISEAAGSCENIETGEI